jgi:hypothetical protein
MEPATGTEPAASLAIYYVNPVQVVVIASKPTAFE